MLPQFVLISSGILEPSIIPKKVMHLQGSVVICKEIPIWCWECIRMPNLRHCQVINMHVSTMRQQHEFLSGV